MNSLKGRAFKKEGTPHREFSQFILSILASFVLAGFGSASALGAEVVAKPKYGPAQKPIATRLYQSHEFIRKNTAPDFWALIPYYQAQLNGAACSVATVAAVVNAARAPLSLGAADELATQESLLKKVQLHHWFDAIKGPRPTGVVLEQLADLTRKSLEVYGLKSVQVDRVHVDQVTDQVLDPALKLFRDRLMQNEKTVDDLMIVNFLQSELTGDPEGVVGHIAAVAAYDTEKKQVLVLDPDRQWYEPYWVADTALLRGMNTLDGRSKKFRGYLYVQFKR